MRVLVTGAAGYFGRQIVPALLADEAVEAVIATDRQLPTFAHPKLRLLRRDLIGDPIEDLFEGVDAVVHLAFRVERTPGEDVAAMNVGAHERFLQLATQRATTLIAVSSVAAYGLRAEPFDRLREDAPIAPGRGFYYAEQKIQAESLLATLAAGSTTRVVCVRPCAVGGPGVDPRRALQFAGRVHLVAASAHPSRVQILHEADLGPAFTTLLRAPAGTYNLAPDDEILEFDLARHCGQVPVKVPRWLYGLACDLTWRLGSNLLDAAWATMLDYPSVIVDNAKLRSLGWRPTRGTLETVQETVAALRARKDLP